MTVEELDRHLDFIAHGKNVDPKDVNHRTPQVNNLVPKKKTPIAGFYFKNAGQTF